MKLYVLVGTQKVVGISTQKRHVNAFLGGLGTEEAGGIIPLELEYKKRGPITATFIGPEIPEGWEIAMRLAKRLAKGYLQEKEPLESLGVPILTGDNLDAIERHFMCVVTPQPAPTS